MSRKGHYLGGGTRIGRKDTSWFKEGSTRVVSPPDVSAPKPPRAPREQAEFEQFQQAKEGAAWTIVKPKKLSKQTRKKLRLDPFE